MNQHISEGRIGEHGHKLIRCSITFDYVLITISKPWIKLLLSNDESLH
jgi:hypothetical protein